jgi:hypothetical protein
VTSPIGGLVSASGSFDFPLKVLLQNTQNATGEPTDEKLPQRIGLRRILFRQPPGFRGMKIKNISGYGSGKLSIRG